MSFPRVKGLENEHQIVQLEFFIFHFHFQPNFASWAAERVSKAGLRSSSTVHGARCVTTRGNCRTPELPADSLASPMPSTLLEEGLSDVEAVQFT